MYGTCGARCVKKGYEPLIWINLVTNHQCPILVIWCRFAKLRQMLLCTHWLSGLVAISCRENRLDYQTYIKSTYKDCVQYDGRCIRKPDFNFINRFSDSMPAYGVAPSVTVSYNRTPNDHLYHKSEIKLLAHHFLFARKEGSFVVQYKC